MVFITHGITGGCFYFSFIASLGNSTVQYQNIPLYGKREQGEVYMVDVSFYSFLMIFGLAACKERLLFIVTQPRLLY